MYGVYTPGEPFRVTQAQAFTDQDVTLLQFICDASTGGTLTLTDRGGSRTLISGLALVAGQTYQLNCRLNGSVTLTIGGTGSGMLTLIRG